MNRCVKSLLLFIFIIILTSCASFNGNLSKEDKKNKRIAEINIQLGLAYLERQDAQRAKNKLLYALKMSPKLPEAWYSMAYFYEATGNKVEAKKYYLKSLELAPNRGDVLNNYGTYLCRSGHYPEAVQYFLLATKDPQYLDAASAYENAGFCALKIPDRKHAVVYFSRAVEEDPSRLSSLRELNKLQ